MTGLSLLIICMQQQSSLLAAASGPAPYRNHEWSAAAQLPAAPSLSVPVTFVWLPTSPTTTIRHSYTTVNNIVSTTFIFFDCQENSTRIRPCLKFIKNQIEIIRIHRSPLRVRNPFMSTCIFMTKMQNMSDLSLDTFYTFQEDHGRLS